MLLGFKEELMETLNMLTNGDIYHLNYEDIKIVFKNNSRTTRKEVEKTKGFVSPSSSTSIFKNEIGGMLEDLKIEILHTFAM